MVMKCEPSLMTMCLPWRTILNPAFSNACTARRWEYTVRGRRWIDCIGRMVMRPSDREIGSQSSASAKPTLPLRARRNHEGSRSRRQDNPQWRRECSALLPAPFLLATSSREARGNSPRNLRPTYEARSDIEDSSQNFTWRTPEITADFVPSDVLPTHAPRLLAPKTDKPPRHSCAQAAS